MRSRSAIRRAAGSGLLLAGWLASRLLWNTGAGIEIGERRQELDDGRV
jgi:hypothetical protein